MSNTITTVDRHRCLRCGSTERLTHHHVIPRALARTVEPDYWEMSIAGDVTSEVRETLARASERFRTMPHYTQRLCESCHRQVHREIVILSKRKWEAERHQCNSECDFLECEFWRQFDLGNLFQWFAPESPLAASPAKMPPN